ncbi:MAG TPA: hypothetical protein VK663_07735 [Burkholderiales bacterium]|nr:hypothetical protein [Burkholderiales bacterium]
MRKCKSLMCAVLAALVMSGPAQAAIISLGQVVSPVVFDIANGALLGNFEDRYTFSVAPGHTFEFAAFASTGFSNRFGIDEFAGSLFAGENLLISVDAVRRTTPEGFPSDDLLFSPLALAAGDYSVVLTGDAFGAFEGITASYSGNLSFAPAAGNVSTPGTLVLLMAGLMGLVIAIKNRRTYPKRGSISNF